MDNKIKKKIEELVNIINKWNKEYFDDESPTVSDRVYDSHLKELIELENKYPQYILDNSPTKKIGASTKSKFKKVTHDKPMLSLNKAYNFDELNKFFKDINEVTSNENIKFLVQPKIDGLSISLKYKNGFLDQATTRGDGTIGEDVTFNIKNIINDVPTEIDYKNDLEVRGEIYISKSIFNKIVETENVEYANARNLASGTLRQLDSSVVKRRNLSCFIYEVVSPEKHKITTQEEMINFLNKNNFVFPTDFLICSLGKKEEIFDFIKLFELDEKRENMDYEIDGMVIKLNEIKYYDDIGFTSKFPKYAIAYKFDEELSKTILDGIFITIGRTGIVTYNAKLKKVLLKGTMVSAATLHNYNYVEELGINIGDEVVIKKAGEIIPKVVSLSKKNSAGVFKKITICPYCKSELFDTKTQNNQVCLNDLCPEIMVKKIIHFASKQAMDIEGLGEGIVRSFFDLGFLKKIEDIFILEKFKEQIINEKGFGEKFWFNLINGIKNSYDVELHKLVFALGIPQLGSKNAKAIARKIKKFENILNLTEEEMLLINDVGEITIKEFFTYIKKEENVKLINYLISIGINPIYETMSKKNLTFFEGKTFVITGTFDITRNEIIKIIEDNGGNVTSSVSKKTFALLAGDDSGSKEEKAKKLNIKIIYKDELKSILEN